MNVKTKITNKILSILLSLMMLLSLVTMTAFAQGTDASVTTYSVGDYDTLKSKIDSINAAGSGEYILSLSNNITINETGLNALTLNKPVTVTLLGSGYTITGTGKTNMFNVQGGATLILGAADETDTLVLDANEQGYGIDVTNGTLKMYEGVTIKNTKFNTKGGVYVAGASAAFYMYGGTITACHVTSTGGNGGGGIIAHNNSTLEITKGTISYCSAGKAGGGILIDGNASAKISNAVITNNYVGKIKDAPGSAFDGMSYWGGGIFIGNLSGPITIEKCQIINNKAYGWYGGGIAIANDSKKIVIDACQITGNSCWRYGGGVALLGYDVNESDGIIISNSTITGNTALVGGGGIANSSNKLTLQNTAVYANHADVGGDDFLNRSVWLNGFEYVSTTLCEVPDGLTLTEGGKEVSITGWYEDGLNMLGAEETALRWGDAYYDGYYCSAVSVPTAPVTTDIALKAAYDLNNVHDHVYENWTSNEDGTHTGHCNVDGCNETKIDNCSGGTATCKDPAVCQICNTGYGSVDSANHADYGTELKNKQDATCTTDGYTGDICCKGCTALLEEGDAIPGGHNFGTDWDYDENNHYHSCTACVTTDAKESHRYGDWVVTKEATTQTEGSREKTCVCGYKIVESIAKIQQTGSPQTGDDSNMVLWFALLLISAGAVITLTVYGRKRRTKTAVFR